MDAFEKEWWWLTPNHTSEKCESALAWETARRTKSYPPLWRKWHEQILPIFSDPTRRDLGDMMRKWHLLQTARQVIPEPYMNLFRMNFDPKSHWLELSDNQRWSARGYTIHNGTPIKLADELLLPRQTSLQPNSVAVGICEIDRNSNGHLLVKPIRDGDVLEQVQNAEWFQRLQFPNTLTFPARFLYAHFDTRQSRNVLLDAWDQQMIEWLGLPKIEDASEYDWKKIAAAKNSFAVLWNPGTREPQDFWTPDANTKTLTSRPKQHEIHVVPSNVLPFAILLVPATHSPVTFRAAFHTQLKKARFDKWFPSCVAHWKTQTVEIPIASHNADGGFKRNAKGFQVYEKIVRFLFDPKEHLPQKQKTAKSARRVNPWLGLAANDVVCRGQSLLKKTPATDFLCKFCAAGNSAEPFAIRRRKSSYELRNHQRSAKERLDELDNLFGNLDKALDDCLDENTKKWGLSPR